MMTPRWYDINCGTSPAITSNHIPYFHSLLCEWAYSVPLSFFWVVVIDAQNRSHLINSIMDVGNLEPSWMGKWNINQQDIDKIFNEQTQDTIGCIFADQISIPGVNSMTTGMGGSDINGQMKGVGMNGRAENEPIKMQFRETNTSFTDLFLRPWKTVATYKGLLADDGGLSGSASYWGGSIKANIHLYQLAKAGTPDAPCTQSVIRKEMHFYDAVPISIDGDTLRMTAGEANMKQATFVYNYSTIGSGNGN